MRADVQGLFRQSVHIKERFASGRVSRPHVRRQRCAPQSESEDGHSFAGNFVRDPV
jgi:hypothetical protein